MITYIECPSVTPYEQRDQNVYSVFLGGGITNCWDWQAEIVRMFKEQYHGVDINLVLINPRRSNFDITDPTMSAQQISWEHDHLHTCDLSLFWFPAETLCPITLFELGVAIGENRSFVVGCDPNYQRKFDVEHQVKIEYGTSKEIHSSLQAMVDTVLKIVQQVETF